MDLLRSMSVAASGLTAQSSRMRIVAENIANADSISSVEGGNPYRRKIPTFKSEFDRELQIQTVAMGRVRESQSDFPARFEPGHPSANEEGYVLYPNVNSIIEMADMREAQRSYQANLNVITTARQMIGQTLDILRG